jgi:PAS domain-containing protein
MRAAVAYPRPHLRVVDPLEPATYTSFCSHCGAHGSESELNTRVCPECSAGLLLETSPESLPTVDDAFLVVDSSLTVQAVSRVAEEALGVREEHAINRHVTELLIQGDTEPAGGTTLAGAIVRAASGVSSHGRVTVRPTHTFGVRMRARIVWCGPPAAALVVLDRALSA